MNILVTRLGVVAVISLLIGGCTWQIIQSEPAEGGEGGLPKVMAYQAVLGKSLNEKDVIDFIAANCSAVDQFQVCKEIGMALWTDADQIVKTVWLYSGNADGFRRYRGELPYGLTFYDPMWRVEEKLSALDAEDTSQTPLGFGLPEEGSSPDHLHYWAIYEQLGLIVIYDFPYRDADAYIYAVVVKI